MEPFGILQFLQNLLSDTQKNANQTQPVEQEDLQQNSSQPPTQKANSPKDATIETVAQESLDTRTQDAILRFMESHDERAKKFKR